LAASAVLLWAAHAGASGVIYTSGDVFAGVGAGQIKHFSPTGTLLDTLNTGCGAGDTLGMAWDMAGNLYATVSFGCTAQVYKFDGFGNLLGPFGTGYSSSVESVVIDNAQNVYVGQPDGTRTIRKYNSAGTFLTEYAPAVESRGTDFIALAADQCTMFYTSEGTSVKRFDVCTNTQLADFATGLAGPLYQFKLLTTGGLLVAANSQAFELDATGAVIATYPSTDGTLFALDRDPDSVTFWTAGLSTGNVYRYNITPAGPPIFQFNAGILGFEMAGLGVFGELIVGQPTPTPGGPTPTPGAPTPTPGGGPTAPIPTLSVSMLALLGVALLLVAILVIRRQA
jgi:hypothetical protein